MSVKSEEMKALPPKISNLDLTKNDILQDDLKRDQLLEKSYREVKKEMDDCTNTPFNAFDYATKTHKDPVNEAKVYLAKQDVIQIFKSVTVGLVLNKPNDPIKSIIEQLRLIQAQREEENANQSKD